MNITPNTRAQSAHTVKKKILERPQVILPDTYDHILFHFLGGWGRQCHHIEGFPHVVNSDHF